MAVVQLRSPTEGRAYYDRKKAAGKTSMEAMRCLKRRLSDVVYRQLLADAIRPSKPGPGGHSGAALDSSAVDSTPISTLRRSHFPDPPAITLPARKALDQTVLRPVPDAPKQRRPAAVVKRSLLDDGEDRRIIDRRVRRLIDIEGSQISGFVSSRWDAEIVTVAFVVQTLVMAPPDLVFAASLSIDDHLASMAASREQVIAGVTAGHIGLGQSVTWRARHFGISWAMTSQITELEEPDRFVDAQLRGPFKTFRHEHSFRAAPDGTEMHDSITFQAPLGPLGWIAERILLSWYLPHLIRQRNDYLKHTLERAT